MRQKLLVPLFLLAFILATDANWQQLLADDISSATPEAMIAQCEQKSADNRFELHHCLLGHYERLQKKTDRLTDQLLGMVGKHRAYGRLKIIQWSNAITKSQSRWQKLVPWDCEWEGHVLPSAKGAAVAIDRCGVKRAAKRVVLLEKRVKTLNIAIMDHIKRGK